METTGKKMRILIIDDEESVHRNLTTMLSSGNYELVSAKMPMEAYEKAIEHQPDLILLDLHMPSPDGMSLLSRLRSNQATRQVPILMMTDSDQDKDLDMAQRLGEKFYILKPLNAWLLQRKISQLREPQFTAKVL